MTEDKKRLLTDLEFRVRQMMFLCDTLKEENKRLKLDLETQRQQLSRTMEEFGRMKAKYDSLKTARTITAASVDVKVARTKLAELVRDVDKCINLLHG